MKGQPLKFGEICPICGYEKPETDQTERHKCKAGVKDIIEFREITELVDAIKTAKTFNYQMDKEQKTLRDIALLSFLTLTGMRITEALSVDVDQVTFEEEFIVIKDVRIQKRRKERIFREFGLPKVGILGELTTYVIKHYKTKKKGKLFDLSRFRAWQIIKKMSGFWCHYFRSQRISYLVNRLGSSLSAARIQGIKASSTIDHYYVSDWRQFKDKLKE